MPKQKSFPLKENNFTAGENYWFENLWKDFFKDEIEFKKFLETLTPTSYNLFGSASWRYINSITLIKEPLEEAASNALRDMQFTVIESISASFSFVLKLKCINNEKFSTNKSEFIAFWETISDHELSVLLEAVERDIGLAKGKDDRELLRALLDQLYIARNDLHHSAKEQYIFSRSGFLSGNSKKISLKGFFWNRFKEIFIKLMLQNIKS